MIWGDTALFFAYKIQWPIQARGPLLVLDQTEAWRTENFFWRQPSALSKGLDVRPPLPPLFQGPDPALK